MALTGRSLASAVIAAAALAIFAPVLATAAGDISYANSAYGPYLKVALDFLPVIAAALAILILARGMQGATP